LSHRLDRTYSRAGGRAGAGSHGRSSLVAVRSTRREMHGRLSEAHAGGGGPFGFPGTEGHGSSTACQGPGTSEGMTESFAQLFEESLANQRIRPGMILTGLIVDVTSDVVIVNVGLKSEAVIPLEQFKNERGEVEVKAGDQVEVALDSVEDGTGETRLSREKAKRARTSGGRRPRPPAPGTASRRRSTSPRS